MSAPSTASNKPANSASANKSNEATAREAKETAKDNVRVSADATRELLDRNTELALRLAPL